MAITYIHPVTNEAVTKEPWRWVAVYDDNSRLYQFEVSAAGAIFHQSAEIDAGRLRELRLEHDTYPPVVINYPAGATLMHFYRVAHLFKKYADDNGEEYTREFIVKYWVAGFRRDGHYWLTFADEQGNVIFTDDVELFNDTITQGDTDA